MKKHTYLMEGHPNTFFCTNISSYLPELSKEQDTLYGEYEFLKEMLLEHSDIQLLSEEEILYVRIAKFLFRQIEFQLVLDLDYSSTHFYVEDLSKLNSVRDLVEEIISKLLWSKGV